MTTIIAVIFGAFLLMFCDEETTKPKSLQDVDHATDEVVEEVAEEVKSDVCGGKTGILCSIEKWKNSIPASPRTLDDVKQDWPDAVPFDWHEDDAMFANQEDQDKEDEERERRGE